jgi:hypothetical protein
MAQRNRSYPLNGEDLVRGGSRLRRRPNSIPISVAWGVLEEFYKDFIVNRICHRYVVLPVSCPGDQCLSLRSDNSKFREQADDPSE